MNWRSVVRPGGRLSIRRQLFFVVTGVHMILMASFVVDLVSRQHTYLLERARSRALQQAAVIAAGSVPQLMTRDFAGLQDVVVSLQRDTSVQSAAVLDEEGRIVAHTDPKHNGKYFQDNLGQFTAKSDEQVLLQETPSTVRAAAPVRADNHVLGWAVVVRDLTVERAELTKIRQTGIIYASLAVMAGAIFALLLAQRITRQLRLLLAGTKRLAQNNLDEPVPVVTDNDVGVVSRAFNQAMTELKLERTRLRDAQTQLEEEVRERRRAEEQLKAANRAMANANDILRQFAYAASHDLQEPLRGVSAYSQLLHQRYSGKIDQDADDFIGYIHQGAKRMQNMIKALLDYSRAAGADEPPSAVNTNIALSLALNHLELAIEDTGAKVHFHDLPSVEGHEIAVVQLFQNLVGNAIKYAGPNPPEITISAEPADEGIRWLFSVQDNGIGIDTEHHKRIFGIFKRLTGNNSPGTGVGLAICTKIVERYGGRIWVESQPGVGATFKFTLPAAASQQTASDVSKQLSTPVSQTSATRTQSRIGAWLQ